MGRAYIVSQTGIAVSATRTLFELTAPTDGMVRILSVHIGQSSDEGEEGDEQIGVVLQRTDTAVGGGTSLTPRPVQVGHAAAGSTVNGNISGQGTPQLPLYSEVWNVESGYHHEPTPLGMVWVEPGGFFGVRLTTAPADELTMAYSMAFEEFD